MEEVSCSGDILLLPGELDNNNLGIFLRYVELWVEFDTNNKNGRFHFSLDRRKLGLKDLSSHVRGDFSPLVSFTEEE